MKRLAVGLCLALALNFSGLQYSHAASSPEFYTLAEYTLPQTEEAGGQANIILSAKLINNKVVNPGEIFSYNKTVGPRTISRGFTYGSSVAWTGRGYQLVPDVGGGVCRTATVLHQAVKKAGLTPIERHNHSLEVPYAKQGEDAAVWYGKWDYKFKNTLPYPVKIVAYADSEKVEVKIEAYSPVKVQLNEQLFNNKAALFFKEGTTMIFWQDAKDLLNLTAATDPLGTVTFEIPTEKEENKKYLKFANNSSTAILSVVSGEATEETLLKLPAATEVKDGNMYIPLRTVCEVMNYDIAYNEQTNKLIITQKGGEGIQN
ncbi:Copper amine oxidase N-terminal domain-containing protein [Desulforamulus putei DSM 12395]|uniref:Copper amine oxidase N-terminal domain-containing protein n=1 Tax=Desulforamulus putei DSM 12395 TaxID=1121429 RepID=A0A1M5CM30_9FIRM|nr:VanW family protein [Desulforamulus putei]SHF55773.1 Copper amine oxidase N-terminal domain-containing protein [Desulforamulus putei DSM 12395]